MTVQVDTVAADPTGPAQAFALDRKWVLHPQAALRPESFGALAYHFGTRKLSFLKDPRLLEIVQGLDGAPTARAACAAAGVTGHDLPPYVRGLAVLAASQMIVERGDRS